MTAYFVTGTDTGVGKTRVSVALLHALRRQHANCVGMKPVAAGCDWVDRGWLNEDVAALRAASTIQVAAALDNPYALPDAMSPHLAAQKAKMVIELDEIESSFQALSRLADAVVVEGAGGFVVPLQEDANHWVTSADLAVRLQLPVVMVVGVRLGCLNHALLTQEAIAARGLILAGWVANVVDPQMTASDANVETLRRRIHAPMLAHWPWNLAATPESLAQTLTLP